MPHGDADLGELHAPVGPLRPGPLRPTPLTPADLADLQAFHLEQRTPLWFYVLHEAQVVAGGEHLGPVGGRIVAERIIGLIEGDRQSWLREDPDRTPTHGSGGAFGIADLLRTADVVATR